MSGQPSPADRAITGGARVGNLDERRLRLAGLLAMASDALVLAAPDGRILFLSNGAERMFRCSAEEAKGQRLCRFFPKLILDDDGAVAPRPDARAGAARQAATVEGARADGEAFCAETTIARVDAGGDAVYAVTVRAANPTSSKLMGYTPADVVGTTPRVVQSGGHDLSFYQRLLSTLLPGEDFRGMLADKNRDGTLAHPEETIAPIKDADGNVADFVQTEQALRRLNDSLEHQARRIAQALHDEAGQLLTPAQIALAEAARSVPRAARERIREAREYLDQIEECLRRLAHEIRPRILDDLGLVSALEFLSQGVQARRGISVSVRTALEGRLPALVETTVYRLVQEALTNATKHGRAKRIAIALERAPQALRCTIEDDGVGFDAAAGTGSGERGLGLSGIRRQLETLGGTLGIESGLGRGTRLIIVIPLEK